MKKFEHFIITRFNLSQKLWENDKNGQEVNDIAWLNQRYNLFEKYCLPSIKAQSNSNFKWLVYFDTNTPSSFKEKNQNFHRSYSNFIPMYVDNFEEFNENLSNDIKRNCDFNSEYIITTRIDNDDCFHIDAVRKIQENFRQIDISIIDLINGLCLQVEEEYKLTLNKNIKLNPFISLVEKNSKKLTTVLKIGHNEWSDKINRIIIDDGFYWIQIIHSRNISNSLKNTLTFNKKYLKGFSINDEVNFTFRYYIFILYNRFFKGFISNRKHFN